MGQDTKERVSAVEKALEDFIRQTNRGFVKLQDAQVDLRLSMADFKEEMQQSHERSEKEMQEFKAAMERSHKRSEKGMQEFKAAMERSHERSEKEMRQSHERSEKGMQEFKAAMERSHERSEKEMRQSRERSEKEMQEFKAAMERSHERSEKEMQKFKNEMNKKWGELANRLGTLAEDFVAPNIPFIAQKYFQCPPEPDLLSARSTRKHSTDKSRIREFDVIAVYDDKVILNETKSTARQSYIDQFAEFIPHFFDYYPEYADKELVPIFATLYVNKQLVDYATRQGIYVLAIKEDTMDLYNYQQVADKKPH